MPKGNRRTSSECANHDTAQEITVRSYDRGIRNRFDEALKAVGMLQEIFSTKNADRFTARYVSEIPESRAARVINLCFGRDIFAEMFKCVMTAETNLRELNDRYDLATVAYLTEDNPANNRQYFAFMSCENLDSFLWDICSKLREKICQMRDIVAIIEDACERKCTRGEGPGCSASARNTKISSRSKMRQIVRADPRALFDMQELPSPNTDGARSSRRVAGDSASHQITHIINQIASADKIPVDQMHMAETFGILKRAMRAADECTMRAMEWAQPICHQGTDVMCCEDCQSRVHILQDMSEAVCDKCGRIATIVSSNRYDASGSSSNDSYMGIVETAHGRRGGYNYTRHLKIWLDRLQAIENEDFDQEDIARIRSSIESEYVSRDLVNWRALSCDDVVRHLALCGRSRLGEHVPKLLKELGGHAPPILDYDAVQVIVRDFMHIMDVYSHLYHEPGNKPYYPFFIAKIIKRRFKSKPEIYRMINYVSKQGHDTVNKNDHIYQQICNVAPAHYDLVYEPEIE